jgi:repressor LexA
MYLTKRQREVLTFIEDFIRNEGYSPSLEEIGEGVGLSSLATIHKHLQNLEDKGVIRRHWNRGRSIEVTNQASMSMLPSKTMELPILGRVAAGVPIEAVEESSPETLCVPQEFVRNSSETFVLRVEGNSMIEDQIADGDFIVVERRRSANNGETIVAMVDGEATVKRFYREAPNLIRLQPANSTMEAMYYAAKDVQIQGIVVGLMRRY